MAPFRLVEFASLLLVCLRCVRKISHVVECAHLTRTLTFAFAAAAAAATTDLTGSFGCRALLLSSSTISC